MFYGTFSKILDFNPAPYLKVHNLSSKPKSISKGTKLATCSADFQICDPQAVGVNLVKETDPVDFLCS